MTDNVCVCLCMCVCVYSFVYTNLLISLANNTIFILYELKYPKYSMSHKVEETIADVSKDQSTPDQLIDRVASSRETNKM